ncbi:MAG: isochorismatase family protein [Deltaproteobacteria bacterium]|nr:isochorismatase family protein [Deltaproteobacteria bacterium]
MATEGDVEGTARTGRNLGYYMVVLKDCAGSKNPDLHDLALKLMEKSHFDVATSKEVADIWQQKG